MLQIEPDPQVTRSVCTHCGDPMVRTTSFVSRDGDALAACYATCYHHEGHEVWIDAIFSPTWADDAEDHVTFGCRVGPIEGEAESQASLVTAAAAWGDSRLFGHKLTRDEALAHPLLPDFWAVVDHLLVHDPVVREHMYGPGTSVEDLGS